MSMVGISLSLSSSSDAAGGIGNVLADAVFPAEDMEIFTDGPAAGFEDGKILVSLDTVN